MINSIQTLSTSHGEALYETCECCNRKVRTIAIMTDGSVFGLQCGITIAINTLSVEDFSLSNEKFGACTIAHIIGAGGYTKMVKKAIESRNNK